MAMERWKPPLTWSKLSTYLRSAFFGLVAGRLGEVAWGGLVEDADEDELLLPEGDADPGGVISNAGAQSGFTSTPWSSACGREVSWDGQCVQ